MARRGCTGRTIVPVGASRTNKRTRMTYSSSIRGDTRAQFGERLLEPAQWQLGDAAFRCELRDVVVSHLRDV